MGVNYMVMDWKYFFDLRTIKLTSGPNFKLNGQRDLFFMNQH